MKNHGCTALELRALFKRSHMYHLPGCVVRNCKAPGDKWLHRVFHALIIHGFWWRSSLKTASAAQLLKINQLGRCGQFPFSRPERPTFRGRFCRKKHGHTTILCIGRETFLPLQGHSTLLLIGSPINGVTNLTTGRGPAHHCTWGTSYPSIFGHFLGAKVVSPKRSWRSPRDEIKGVYSTTVSTQNRHPKVWSVHHNFSYGVHHKNLVTWENRAPKDWQALSLGDVGFLLFLRVVSGDYGKPCSLTAPKMEAETKKRERHPFENSY